MAYTNITLVRGNTFAFGARFRDLDQDLDGAYFTVRKTHESNILIQKTIGNGIEKVETGLYRIRIAPADTDDLNVGMYYYDFTVSVNGDVFTLLTGVLMLDYNETEV